MASRKEGGQLRAVRKEFADVFVPALAAFTERDAYGAVLEGATPGSGSQLARLSEALLLQVLERSFAKVQLLPSELPGETQVYVRKRPVFAWEADDGEYDCVSALHNKAIVHDGRLKNDGRSLYMLHRCYAASRVFDGPDSNALVYAKTTRSLVHWACQGKGDATVLMFGQTGTGKTHTTRALVEAAGADIFGEGKRRVRVSFFELAGASRGGKLCDLLADRGDVSMLADADDKVHVTGGVERDAANVEELRSALEDGFEMRATTSTERNSTSSRSHAFLQLRIQGEAGGGAAVRTFTLVDLAGSERNYETQGHSAAEHRVSAEINKSLMALKDCFRALAVKQSLRSAQDEGGAKRVRIPYRANKLTLMLKACFEDADHHAAVIATVSPTPTDLEHTRNTLDHALGMSARLQKLQEEHSEPVALPRVEDNVVRWDAERVGAFLDAAEEGAFAHWRSVMPPTAGKELMRLSLMRLRHYFGEADGVRLFKAVRAEVHRIDDLHRENRERLVRARQGKRRAIVKPVLAANYAALEVPIAHHDAVGIISIADNEFAPDEFSPQKAPQPAPEEGGGEHPEELEQENLQPAGAAPGEVAPLHTEAGAYFEA